MTKLKTFFFSLLLSLPASGALLPPGSPFPEPTPQVGELLNGLWLGEGEGFVFGHTVDQKKGHVFLNLSKKGPKLHVKAAIVLDDAKVIRLWLDGTYDIVTRDERNFVLLNDVVVGEIHEGSNGTRLYLSYFDLAADGAVPVFPALSVLVSAEDTSEPKAAQVYYGLISAKGMIGEFSSSLPLLMTPKSKSTGGWGGWGEPPFPDKGWGSGWSAPSGSFTGGFGSPWYPGWGFGRPGFGNGSFGSSPGLNPGSPFAGSGAIPGPPPFADYGAIPGPPPFAGTPFPEQGNWALPGTGWSTQPSSGLGGFPPPPNIPGWGLPTWDVTPGHQSWGLPPWSYGAIPPFGGPIPFANASKLCSDTLTRQ